MQYTQPRLHEAHEDLPLFTVADEPAPEQPFQVGRKMEAYRHAINDAKQYPHAYDAKRRAARMEVYRQLILTHGSQRVLRHVSAIKNALDKQEQS